MNIPLAPSKHGSYIFFWFHVPSTMYFCFIACIWSTICWVCLFFRSSWRSKNDMKLVPFGHSTKHKTHSRAHSHDWPCAYSSTNHTTHACACASHNKLKWIIYFECLLFLLYYYFFFPMSVWFVYCFRNFLLLNIKLNF